LVRSQKSGARIDEVKPYAVLSGMEVSALMVRQANPYIPVMENYGEKID
jgi:hypothetical protein